eukprot:UN14010
MVEVWPLLHDISIVDLKKMSESKFIVSDVKYEHTWPSDMNDETKFLSTKNYGNIQNLPVGYTVKMHKKLILGCIMIDKI